MQGSEDAKPEAEEIIDSKEAEEAPAAEPHSEPLQAVAEAKQEEPKQPTTAPSDEGVEAMEVKPAAEKPQKKKEEVIPPAQLPDVPLTAPSGTQAAPAGGEVDVDLDYGDSDDDKAAQHGKQGAEPAGKKSAYTPGTILKEKMDEKKEAQKSTMEAAATNEKPRSGLFGAAMASLEKPSIGSAATTQNTQQQQRGPARTTGGDKKKSTTAPVEPLPPFAQDQSRKRLSREGPGPSEEISREKKQPRREEPAEKTAGIAAIPGGTQSPFTGTAGPKAPQKGAPKSQGSTTRALRIEGFVRPFTLNAARDLLGKSGTVLSMWMPTIKNLCWVIFKTKSDAETAYEALWDLRWPDASAKLLKPQFVKLSAAEKVAGGKSENVAMDTSDLGTFTMRLDEGPRDLSKAGGSQQHGERGSVGDRSKNDTGGVGGSEGRPIKDLRELLSRKKSVGGDNRAPAGTGAGGLPFSGAEDKREIVSMDKLFRPTEAKPKIYWLPLTDEAVELKRKAMAAVQAVPQRRR